MAMHCELSLWEPEAFGEDLIDWTVGQLIDQQARDYRDRDAVVYRYPEQGIDIRWTYGQLKERVDRLARGLLALGIGLGDKVAVLATNLPEWILMELATGKIGAVLVTVNTNSRRQELDYALRQADVHTVVFMRSWRDNDYLATLTDLVPEFMARADAAAPVQSTAFPSLRHAFLMDGLAVSGIDTLARLEALAERIPVEALAARQAQVKPQDVFQIQFTSGTTGNPKGAMITHHAAINNGRLFASRAGFKFDDRLLSAMPLFHTAGNVMEVMGVLTNGAALIKAISFDAHKMLELLDHERATILSAVPTMVIAMLQRHEECGRSFNTSALRFVISGGTPIPVPMMEQVQAVFGAQPVIGFGMTETSPMVTGTLSEDSFALKSATVGIPLAHTGVKVANSEGRPVPQGEAGELCIRGYLVTKGYYKEPGKTAETIDAEGWLHSGDLATMDASGYVRIVGRIKDMIIRGGENIYPAEVENFLMRHPAVKQAQVVGVPDAYMGEEAAAFVQLREGMVLSDDELRDYCKRNIARHKVPKYFRFVTDFPLTPSGKVKKFELRAQMVTQIEEAADHAAR